MGYRLHVAKTYRVEYGDGYFNHCTETINQLLGELCPCAWFDDEQRCFSTKWEIVREELQEAIQTIKNDTEYYDRLLRSRNIEYDAKEFAEILETYLKQSDKDNDYVVLEWF
jgi:nicotinamide riboside kinase